MYHLLFEYEKYPRDILAKIKPYQPMLVRLYFMGLSFSPYCMRKDTNTTME